jgi:hypothetical protein
MTLGPLSTHLKKFDCENKLEDLSKFVEACDSHVSFWGQRVVTTPNYSGEVSLEWLTRQVQLAQYKKIETNSFSLAERIAGLGIVKQLENFYAKTDQQIPVRNFLTRFFNWIREFSVLPYTTRFYLEELTGPGFRAYTRDNFERIFGPPSDVRRPWDHAASDGGDSFSGTYVREALLRKRFAEGSTE